MSVRQTWAAAERARAEIGSLLDTHDNGLSFEALAAYRGRFADFCHDLFRLELTPQQLDGADALEDNRQVLICGGNGVGKDTLMAARTLYEVYVEGALALLSGPTDRQVREVSMRREIGRLWRMAAGKLPGERYEMAIRIPGREEGGLLAFTASDPDKFVGHHSASGRVFIGLTEAQGIQSEIFQAAQRCQPTRMLAACNPTSPTTAVYGFSRATHAWRTLYWSCLDHPNVTSGEAVVPGAVTREWVDAMRLEHGESSRFWLTAVIARFPEESESPLFIASRWEDALRRTCILCPAVVGVDVSRGGDDQTALAVRRGNVLWDLLRYREPDTQTNAERIAHEVRKLIAAGIGVESVVVDESGEGGVFDKFTRLASAISWREVVGLESHRPDLVTRRVQALGFKSSRQAQQPERFANLRAQSFCHLGVEFEEGRAVIRPDIDADLLADLREELLDHQRIHQADDRILIAPKDEIRRTLGRSPDLADAYAMSFLPDLKVGGKKAQQVLWV